MGWIRAGIGWGALVLLACAEDPSKVWLREGGEAGSAWRILWTFEAEGTIRPAATEGQPAPAAAPLKLSSRVELIDHGLAGTGQGIARSWRTIRTAEATIEGGGALRSSRQALRKGRATLVAERRAGRTTVASPNGALTRAELELAQGPIDPLELGELLPSKEVSAGDRWRYSDGAARVLTGYERIETHDLEGRVESIEAGRAKLEIRGEASGQLLGAGGRMKVVGALVFDRAAGRVTELELRRSEVRAAGPVEAGLEMQGSLRLTRRAATSEEGGSGAAPAVPEELPGAWLDLEYDAPGGRYRLTLDRGWHVVGEDEKQVVLRRLRDGSVIAQGNLAVAPTLDPTTRADLPGFQAEVRKALGERFERFVEVGEVGGIEPGGTRFRVAALGKQDGQAIRWTYYRVLGPRGEQVVGAFTMREDRAEAFGDADTRLIQGFRWGAGGG